MLATQPETLPWFDLELDEQTESYLRSTVPEVIQIETLVEGFFDGNAEKRSLWMRTKNPLLGNVTPWALVGIGRQKKLLRAVQDMLAGIGP